MKKMGIAVLAGMFTLVSVAAYAGPNVGGENFNIQARSIQRDHTQGLIAMYARTGRPKIVSNWKWVKGTKPRFRSLTVQPLKRVPAN